MANLDHLLDDPIAAAEALGTMMPEGPPDGDLWDDICDAAQQEEVRAGELLIAYGRGQERAHPPAHSVVKRLLEEARELQERAILLQSDAEALIFAEQPRTMGRAYEEIVEASSEQELCKILHGAVVLYRCQGQWHQLPLVGDIHIGPSSWISWAAAYADERPDLSTLFSRAARRAEELGR